MDKNRQEGTHILVVTQYFYPEPFRINDLCLEWLRRGYRVTVLTGIPNYPEGKFYAGYGLRRRRRENWNGVEIIRLPLIPRGKSKWRLALNYLSFPLAGFFWKIGTRQEADLVFNFEVSPMTQVKVGCGFARKRRIPCILYLQDLWPDNVMDILGGKAKVLEKPIHGMVNKIYRDCDLILTTSRRFLETLAERGVDRKKLRNWPQYAEELPAPTEAASAVPLDGRLKIIFTGNIGYAQGLDILVKVAKRFAEEAAAVEQLQGAEGTVEELQGTARAAKHSPSPPLLFILVGGGRYLDAMKEEIKAQGLEPYFLFIERQPPEQIPALLRSSHLAFLSLQAGALAEKTIPAKLQSYMSCAMPILAAAAGETKEIIEEDGIGFCVPPGDDLALYRQIHDLTALSKERLLNMGQKARAASGRRFDKMSLMNELDEMIAALLGDHDSESEKTERSTSS